MATPKLKTRFNADEADRAQRFFERALVHTKGRFARSPFVLAPWQRDDIIRPLYGQQVWDLELKMWVRLHRFVWFEVGRKNGKSEIAAGIALKGLVADREEEAEVYGAAEDKDQAEIVYRVAKRMVELSPRLSKRLRVIDSLKRIVHEKSGSFYQVLPRDRLGEGSQGFNPHVVVVDEVHVQKSPDLIDALKRGMGTRTQPIVAMVTTAGALGESVYNTEHDYSASVVAGEVKDPRRLIFMRNTPDNADPFDEKNWCHANPALGDFLSIEVMRQEAREAQAKPTEEASFCRFRLNMRRGADSKWFTLSAWDRSAGLIEESELEGRSCYGGLDLASTTDLAACTWSFPDDEGGYDSIWRFWMPSSRVEALDKMTAGKGSIWIREGFIRVHDGDIIDFDAIFTDIDHDARRFRVTELAVDPWQSHNIQQKLTDGGLTVWSHGQGMAQMASPTKEVERLVFAGKLRHGGNPVARWMAGNTVVKQDSNENIKPDRNKSTGKIDGMLSLIYSIGAATRLDREQPKEAPNVW